MQECLKNKKGSLVFEGFADTNPPPLQLHRSHLSERVSLCSSPLAGHPSGLELFYCFDTHSRTPSGDLGPPSFTLSLSNTPTSVLLALLRLNVEILWSSTRAHLNDTATRNTSVLLGRPASKWLFCLRTGVFSAH